MQVVDTTGAGDCFTGAVAVGILEGMSYQDAMRFAGLTPKPLAATSGVHCISCAFMYRLRLVTSVHVATS